MKLTPTTDDQATVLVASISEDINAHGSTAVLVAKLLKVLVDEGLMQSLTLIS